MFDVAGVQPPSGRKYEMKAGGLTGGAAKACPQEAGDRSRVAVAATSAEYLVKAPNVA